MDPPPQSQKRQKQSRQQQRKIQPQEEPIEKQQINDRSTIMSSIQHQVLRQHLQGQHLQQQTAATPQITLKLIINRETEKLLFAEAGKDFVDFLFSIPSLPIGAFLSLVQHDDDVERHLVSQGSLVNLYKTIDNLDERYMQPQYNQITKQQKLLFPTTSQNIRSRLQSSRVNNTVTTATNNNSVHSIFANSSIANNNYTGYVRGTTTYMIMDDLNVEPMSVVSSVSFLDRFGALDVNKLEEREVVVGDHESLMILKKSMVTKNVLTSVFMGRSNVSRTEAVIKIEDSTL